MLSLLGSFAAQVNAIPEPQAKQLPEFPSIVEALPQLSIYAIIVIAVIVVAAIYVYRSVR